jgi:hypothetical protein
MHYKNVFVHVSDNLEVMKFLLFPILKLFPTDEICVIKDTYNKVEKELLNRSMAPFICDEATKQLIESELKLSRTKNDERNRGIYLSQELTKTSERLPNETVNNKYMKLHTLSILSNPFKKATLAKNSKETIYITLLSGLCSIAQEQGLISLNQFPVHDIMLEVNHKSFEAGVAFLHGQKHEPYEDDYDENDHLPIITQKAFTQDFIAFKNFTSIKHVYYTETDRLVTPTKRGRPKKIIDTPSATPKKRGRPPGAKNKPKI